MFTVFLALCVSAFLLSSIGIAGVHLFGRFAKKGIDDWLCAALSVAVAGYVVFWACFWRPQLGRSVSWAITVLAVFLCIKSWKKTRTLVRANAVTLAVVALTGTFYAAIVVTRFDESWIQSLDARLSPMPGDNRIPTVFTEIIDSGNPTREIGASWLTSDRPPLQSAVNLLVLPVERALGVDMQTYCSLTGLWLQLLWIPAMISLLTTFGLKRGPAVSITCMLAFTGFLFFNSIYVWPKLDAAAFAIYAFVELFFASAPASKENVWIRSCLVGASASCAWLLHGGVMFAFLAGVPLALLLAQARKVAFYSSIAFAILAIPWISYQRWYAPPANRLLKWHLAGVIPIDGRPTLQTLRDSYREIGWKTAWDNRKVNVGMLGNGLFDFRVSKAEREDVKQRRAFDVAFPLSTASIWWLGVIGIPMAAWRLWRLGATGRAYACRQIAALAALLLILAFWLLLMFSPNAVFTHQGTYVTQLLLFALLASWSIQASWILFVVVALLQAIEFATTWVFVSSTISLSWIGVVIAALSAAGLLLMAALNLLPARNQILRQATDVA